MTIVEVIGDLFNLSEEYMLVHCISADFALGAGIAAKFNTLGVKKELLNKFPINNWNNKGYCLIVNNPIKVANLVTKERCFHKPKLSAVAEALIDLRNQLDKTNITKIGMPLIGCGLDKLEWKDVKNVIYEVFKDTEYDIVICKLFNVT